MSKVRKVSLAKLDEFFSAIAHSERLYLPVDTAAGAEYKEWAEGTKWSDALNTVRSAKDFFFPQTENLMDFKMQDKKIELIDTRRETEDFVVFGVRACDARAFRVLDNVFLAEPVDTYYQNRRKHGTIVTVACTRPVETCFCSTFDIDPANADALARFDGTYLYEYDSDVGHSEWGTCNFNYYRGEIRSFLNSAAALWMDVYHCDGIRMDAISRAIYWQGDPNRGVNEGALNFLRGLNHGLNERWPTGIYTAEDSTNFLKVTAPTRYDGIGFDYKWDMGWMHDTLDYFATPFGERPDAYHKLTFSMQYFYNELYLLALSHDEVVHGKKTIIDKLWGTYEEKCAQLRTLYFYMYTHPGKKLNFMGNEIAHFREWDEKRPLDWDLLKYPFHDSFQKFFAAVSRLYATEPALYDGEYNPDCFEWVACESRTEGVYAWLRKGAGQNLLCVMNTQNTAHKKFPLYLKFPCGAEELLNTEASVWGGADKSRTKTFHTTDGGVYGRDYTLAIDLPAMGSRLFRLSPEALHPEAAQASAALALNQKRKAARAAKAPANKSKK